MALGQTTLPLDQVYNLLRQPVTPKVPFGVYAEQTERVQTATITSDFFRDIAGQLNNFTGVAEQQAKAYAQRTVDREQQRQQAVQEQQAVSQVEQENLDRVVQLRERQAWLEQYAQEADNTLPAETPADEALVEEASGNGGFFSGLKDLGKGAFDIARGAAGTVTGPVGEILEAPLEVGRELLQGDLGGAGRELMEPVRSVSEPIEAAIEIAREAIRGDLAGLAQELKEAGQEIPQMEPLMQAWGGLNQMFLGEQKIITPFTRPIIRETLQAFQVPDGVSETIAKYVAEVLVPSTFVPIIGQLGKTKGAVKLMKAGLAEGAINMLQNRQGRKERSEEDPSIIEDATMFTFGFGGRIGMEHAARALSKFVTSRGGVKAAAKSLIGQGEEKVTVFHGAGGKLEGDSLTGGSFVTTDRAAAQKYAQVDARLHEVQGKSVEPTVYETEVFRSALGEVPEDATTLGSPFVLKADTPMRPSVEAPLEVKPKADVPAPEPKEGMLSLEHYTAEKNLTEIDPMFSGTGKAGEEANIGGPRVSHFYTAGSKPERMVANLPNKLTVEVPKNKVLDLESEEGLALIDRARDLKADTNPDVALNLGDTRQLAKNEGYSGIFNSSDPLNRVQMLDKTKVIPTDVEPAVFSRAVASTKAEGGTTIDPKTGDSVPYEGYFVGGKVPTKTIPMDEFGEESMSAFVRENAEAYEDGTLKLGTETADNAVNKQVVNIDGTTPIKNKEEALELARARGEERIWDTQANGGKGAFIEVPGVKQTQKVTTGEPKTATKPPEKAVPGNEVTNKLEGWEPAEKASVRTIVTATKRKLGSAAHSWVSQSKRIILKVYEAVKKMGRTFHSDELGQMRLGKQPDIQGVSYGDVMNVGASRRWLHPDESWSDWATFMSKRVGGKSDYWMSTAQRDVREYTEHQMGLIGEGPIGGGVKIGDTLTERFGPPTHPRTYEELTELVVEGSRLQSSTGRVVDMKKWYTDFHQFMKQHFGDDAEIMTMFAAATQANQSPASGIAGAFRAFTDWKLGQPISGQASASIRKTMENIVRGGVPEGPKINPFWNALRFSGERGRNAVAIDRWMFGAIGAQQGRWKNLASNARFVRFTQTIIRESADEAGISPRSFQAAVWGGTKAEWNRVRVAAGQKALSEDFSFFQDLFEKTMAEHGLRAPANFRKLAQQAELFDVEQLERTAIDGLGITKAGETAAERSTRVTDLMYAEWNEKVAASQLLETGEIPEQITSVAARDEVTHKASMYQRDFVDRLQGSDTGVLTNMQKRGRLPSWQKTILDDTIEARKTSAIAPQERLKSLPEAERERLKSLGYDHVPQTVADLKRVHTELLALDKIRTVPALTAWLKRNVDIAGDPQDWVGRNLPTGKTYQGVAGQTFEKHVMSPYWEPKPFYKAGRRLNIERIKSVLKARYPDQRFVDGTKQTIGDALRVNEKSPVGVCA